jgi:hypothetical protein
MGRGITAACEHGGKQYARKALEIGRGCNVFEGQVRANGGAVDEVQLNVHGCAMRLIFEQLAVDSNRWGARLPQLRSTERPKNQ